MGIQQYQMSRLINSSDCGVTALNPSFEMARSWLQVTNGPYFICRSQIWSWRSMKGPPKKHNPHLGKSLCILYKVKLMDHFPRPINSSSHPLALLIGLQRQQSQVMPEYMGWHKSPEHPFHMSPHRYSDSKTVSMFGTFDLTS